MKEEGGGGGEATQHGKPLNSVSLLLFQHTATAALPGGAAW